MTRTQRVDEFKWSQANCLNGERSTSTTGSGTAVMDPAAGTMVLTAGSGTATLVESLRGLISETGRTLNFDAALPVEIKSAKQVTIDKSQITVRGTGTLVVSGGTAYAVVTWNPADKAANATLSNGNKTVTVNAQDASVRATTPRNEATGKYVYEWTYVSENSPQFIIVGLMTAVSSLNFYPGHSADSIGYESDTGDIYVNGSVVATISTATVGDKAAIVIDRDTVPGSTVVHFWLNGVHKTIYTMAGVTLSYPAVGSSSSSSNTASGTANFGATALTYMTAYAAYHSGLQTVSIGLISASFVIASPGADVVEEVTYGHGGINTAVKSLTLSVTSGALTLKKIDFVCTVPAVSAADEALLYTFGALLACWNRGTGRVLDKLYSGTDTLNAPKASGLLALACVAAYDAGLITLADAQTVATELINYLTSGTVPTVSGWFVHFTSTGGGAATGSEYSMVDCAIALIAATIAAKALGLSPQIIALRATIRAIDFAAATNAGNKIAIAFSDAGVLSPYNYDVWGSESALLQLLRWMQGPSTTPFTYTPGPPTYGGRGFIVEEAALFCRQFGLIAPGPGGKEGVDYLGVNWMVERSAHRATQNNFNGATPVYGLSEMDTLQTTGATSYAALGVGGLYQGMLYQVSGEGPWETPSYMAMAASLDAGVFSYDLGLAEFQACLYPLTGLVESTLWNGSAYTRQHFLVNSLREAFSVLGLYHGRQVLLAQTDLIYQAADADAVLSEALSSYFPGGNVWPTYQAA